MSLEVDAISRLRAMAHPVRLRILSLLTSTAMTATEVAAELGLTHANASYHLRQLLGIGIIEITGEEKVRGGVAKRYRYDAERDMVDDPEAKLPPPEDYALLYTALAVELQRRAAKVRPGKQNYLADAEFWVDPQEWMRVRQRIGDAADDLHRAARSPRTPGAIQVSATIALFQMEDGK